MEGRFGFLVPAGIYRLVPEKTHYQFPVMNTSQYQGEDFSIGENDIVDLDIPMERMTADWNEQEKNNIIPIWKRKRKIIDRFFLVIFLGVAFYSGLQFLQIPNILNGFFFGMNILFLLFRFVTHQKRSFGLVYNHQYQPIVGAIITLYYKNNPNILVKKIITDNQSRYYALINTGEYLLKITTSPGQLVYEKTIHIRKNILKKDFQITLD
jgi:hypothetical protein